MKTTREEDCKEQHKIALLRRFRQRVDSQDAPPHADSKLPEIPLHVLDRTACRANVVLAARSHLMTWRAVAPPTIDEGGGLDKGSFHAS